jgi:EmrB/QacA subfamily drug resistance transporter
VKRRRWILVVLCVGQMMVIIDNTVVNVALPTIQRDLAFNPAGLAWVVDAYLITFGGFLLLGGRMGDLLGRKRVLLAGLVFFTAASLLCGLSSSQGELVAGRFVQGIGAAVVSATSLGLIATLYPDPRERVRAMAVYAFVAVTGGSIGLLIGGAVVEALNWHWIFFINLPVGVAALVASWAWVEDHIGLGIRQGADIGGALLITLAPMLAVYGLVTVDQHGWTAPTTLWSLGGAAALVVGFIALESRLRTPLIRLSLFRNRNLAISDLIRGLFGIGTFGLFFLGVLYFQRVRGYSPVTTGLAYLPMTLVSSTISLFVTARLMGRIGAKATLTLGIALFAAGLALWTQVPVHGSYVAHVLPGLMIGGLGGGFVSAPNITLGMSGVRAADTGLASGLISMALQLGAAIGVAVLATLSTTRTQHLLTTGVGAHQALTSGYRFGFTVTTGCVVVALALTTLLRGQDGWRLFGRRPVAPDLRMPLPGAQDQSLGVEEEAAGRN